jgi:hypothetical protein
MARTKEQATFALERDQKEWLERVAEDHELPDASKALRILLDYAMQDGNENEIFETVRCRHCG